MSESICSVPAGYWSSQNSAHRRQPITSPGLPRAENRGNRARVDKWEAFLAAPGEAVVSTSIRLKNMCSRSISNSGSRPIQARKTLVKVVRYFVNVLFISGVLGRVNGAFNM